MQAKLEPATLAATWAEWHSFRHFTRAAYGAGLPLPLSLLMPWLQRRAALQRLGAQTPEQVPPRPCLEHKRKPCFGQAIAPVTWPHGMVNVQVYYSPSATL